MLSQKKRGRLQQKTTRDPQGVTRARSYFDQVEILNGHVDFVHHANGYINLLYAVPDELILTGNEPSNNINYQVLKVTSSRNTSGNKTITYTAGEIDLLKSFNVVQGSSVTAQIQTFTPAGLAYTYALRDHLGNNRVFFSDANNNGSIATSEIISVQAYYPFGLDMRQPNNVNADFKYGFGAKEELELTGYRNFGFRCLDPSICRWTSPDPLAETQHNLSLAPYNFVANNPIRNVDPDGLDWFQNGEDDQVWFNNRDAKYTDDDGVEWSNIGEERLYFGGKNLIYYTQSEDENGNLTLNMEAFEAVSGREKDGTFDYSIQSQATKDRGPIPEGDFSINPTSIQNYSDLSFIQRAASRLGQGQWPGGKYSWGENRVWIDPSSVDVVDPSTGKKVTRTDMSIHGGKVPGSAGCIDCHRDAARFFRSLSKSDQTKIPLRVNYKK